LIKRPFFINSAPVSEKLQTFPRPFTSLETVRINNQSVNLPEKITRIVKSCGYDVTKLIFQTKDQSVFGVENMVNMNHDSCFFNFPYYIAFRPHAAVNPTSGEIELWRSGVIARTPVIGGQFFQRIPFLKNYEHLNSTPSILGTFSVKEAQIRAAGFPPVENTDFQICNLTFSKKSSVLNPNSVSLSSGKDNSIEVIPLLREMVAPDYIGEVKAENLVSFELKNITAKRNIMPYITSQDDPVTMDIYAAKQEYERKAKMYNAFRDIEFFEMVPEKARLMPNSSCSPTDLQKYLSILQADIQSVNNKLTQASDHHLRLNDFFDFVNQRR